MSKLYESTRKKELTITPSKAVLQGLSSDGGLFVLRDLAKQTIDIKKLVEMDYFGIAKEVLRIFVDDFSNEEIERCVNQAYSNKFSSKEITPLIKLEDAYVLELFHGPTSAFKDVGLSMLPQLMSTSLLKNEVKEDILILTATSGDTGKAALEGFKDVDKTKIMVFYPKDGVSKVQETQMKTQEGSNLKVCAMEGNFDDAQNGIKKLFLDEEFKAELKKQNILLSSANSINIGRLVPQMVYYFYAYAKLVQERAIELGDEVNFVVPTGNFGNILAGYYAKMIGLPVHKLVCASNDNNVLYDFIQSGHYNRKREFLKTISPSMDILISSNLERLLYYASGCDNEYIEKLMNNLSTKGEYQVKEDVLKEIQNIFACGYATNEDTAKTIRTIYEKEKYLMDPHTAVAYKVLLEQKENKYVSVVLSTASPYKFTNSVYEGMHGKTELDEFALMNKLEEETGVRIPDNLCGLDKKAVLHKDVIKKEDMKTYILSKIKE